MGYDVSIGIIGKNSSWILRYSLVSLRRSIEYLRSRVKGVDLEVIYVDGGSTDDSKDVVRNMLKDEVRIIDAPGTNIPEARNIVIKESSGNYIIYWDSDIIAPPTALTVLLRAGKPLVGLSRQDVYVQSNEEIENLLNNSLTNYDEKVEIKEVLFTVFSVNLIHRDVFKEVGAFDERLTQAEDRDFGIRTRCRGYKSYLVTNITTIDVNRKLISDVPITTSLRQYLRGIHKKALIYSYTPSRRQLLNMIAYAIVHTLALSSIIVPPLALIETLPLIYQVYKYRRIGKGAEMWIKSLSLYTMMIPMYPLTKVTNICNIINKI